MKVTTYDSYTSDCRFCEIYSTSSVKDIADKILYESKSFYVIPALGCLIKNYIMIVSKRHINSMCYLSTDESNELIEIINKFRSMFKEKYGFYPIVFEHGASITDANRSACCVMHAHIHIVPYVISRQEEMIESLRMNDVDDFGELFSLGYDKPYILFINNQGELYFKDCKNDALPSQIIRKWIAADMGTPDVWDWRTNAFEKNIESTVLELKPLIKSEMKPNDYRLKYVYYCRAMDGFNPDEIDNEYKYIEEKLKEQGRVLVNPSTKTEHNLKMNKTNSKLVVEENLNGISKADCVIVNLSRKNHLYVGCIAEMVYAKERGCYIIVVVGDSGADNHFYTIYHADKIYKKLDDVFKDSDWQKSC
ncbi:MAG: nucleoside 2-deoxyribosyltransferase [Ruminococcus sp.]|nr:nucleoside 2-deoxyribosyltransferase [Ruminococcus sp.]